jgi:hypothetical protein
MPPVVYPRRDSILRHLYSTTHGGCEVIAFRSFAIPPTAILTTPRIPKCRTPMHVRALLHVTLTSPHYRVSRDRDSVVAIPLHGKIPNAEPRLSGLLTRVQSGIYGYGSFRKSRVTIPPYENSMTLETPILR